MNVTNDYYRLNFYRFTTPINSEISTNTQPIIMHANRKMCQMTNKIKKKKNLKPVYGILSSEHIR